MTWNCVLGLNQLSQTSLLSLQTESFFQIPILQSLYFMDLRLLNGAKLGIRTSMNTRYMLFLFLGFPQIWTLFVKEQFPVTRFVICDQHRSQVKFSSVNTLAICRKYSQFPWTTEMSSTNLLEFINAHHVFDVITEPGVQQIISINVIICVL